MAVLNTRRDNCRGIEIAGSIIKIKIKKNCAQFKKGHDFLRVFFLCGCIPHPKATSRKSPLKIVNLRTIPYLKTVIPIINLYIL